MIVPDDWGDWIGFENGLVIDDAEPPVLPVEDDPAVPCCGAVDPTSGAVCTRPAHGDLIHHCKEQDFDFQWKEMPRLVVPP